MFVVYRKAYGQPREPMGHFKTLEAAKQYGEQVYAAFADQEVIIAEEANGERTHFVDDAPKDLAAVAPVGPELTIERASAKGAK